jgi:hypothetical protein
VSQIFRTEVQVSAQSQGLTGPAGSAGVITIGDAFVLLPNVVESPVTLVSTTEILADGQFLYGTLPGNVAAKIRRSGAQYYLKSLFKLPAVINFIANTRLYINGDQTILAIAADVTIATSGPTAIQLEPNLLAVGAKLAATVGAVSGVIEQTATLTTFTPGAVLGATVNLVAYVDAAILGIKAQSSIFDGFRVLAPNGKYWFLFEDLIGNIGFGLLRNFTFFVQRLKIKKILIEQKQNYKYIYRIVDSLNNILFGIRYDGSTEVNSLYIGENFFKKRKNWRYLATFVDSAGNLLLGLLRSGGVEIRRVEARAFSVRRNGALLLRDKGNAELSIPEMRSQVITARNINRFPKIKTLGILHYFPMQGQSNSTGFQVNPYVAKFLRACIGKTYMLQESAGGINYFNVAATIKLAPLIEPMRVGGGEYPINGEGATSMWGMARALSETHLGRDFVSGWDCMGKGSQPYSVIGPGGSGNYFAKSIESLQNFVRLAALQGLSVKVPCVPIIHGESDSENVSYDANLLSWYTAVNTNYKAATLQPENIPLAICQQAAYPWNNPPLDLSWRISRDNPGKIICVEPSWHYHCGDQAHLDEWSREIRRAIKWAQVIDVACFQRRNWRPLEPISAVLSGLTVAIKFKVPVGPLQWDRHVTQPANLYINGASVANPWLNGRGFELRNAANAPITISKAEITAADTVTLTFPSGTPTQVGFARACPYDGSTTLMAGPEFSRRGQLIDSDPHAGWDYQIINCGVTEGSNVITIANEAAALQGWYNFVNGAGLPDDCIIRARTSESSFTLSDPWKGGTGTAPLTMWSDQRNRCVIFNLAI